MDKEILKDTSKIRNVTQYHDINDFLNILVQEIMNNLVENVVGVYLTGSLSYGAFNPNSSDIDLVTILRTSASSNEVELIGKLHLKMEQSHEKLAKILECSYTPLAMLPSILPPLEPRPWYFGYQGILFDKAPYGNEWIINQYLLYEHGISLAGPDYKDLIDPVDIVEVQKACIRDLFKEWEPKITDKEYLNNSHYQSYIILNLCRILYTVMCKSAGSKKVSASWVKHEYGSQWNNLIQTAENWQYGAEMNMQEQTIQFIMFVINQISRSPLYNQMMTNDLTMERPVKSQPHV